MMHQVQLWGKGGYYAIEVDGQGHMGLPSGSEAWERFARYAPDEMVHKAIEAAEAYRDQQKKPDAGGRASVK